MFWRASIASCCQLGLSFFGVVGRVSSSKNENILVTIVSLFFLGGSYKMHDETESAWDAKRNLANDASTGPNNL